jgi:hypothetical protein
MEASIMKLLRSFESIFYVYVEKLPYLKFEFERMYLLVHFTMLGPTKGRKFKLFYKYIQGIAKTCSRSDIGEITQRH